MIYEDYLAHFNPNHDPRNGQFSDGHGGSIGSASRKHELGYHAKKGAKIGAAIGGGLSAVGALGFAVRKAQLGSLNTSDPAYIKAARVGGAFLIAAGVGGIQTLQSAAIGGIAGHLRDKKESKR